MEEEVTILLGVGGTGAKVVEAALVLMAAGVGPRTVHVGLIDQDQSNGNVQRARNLLTTLGNFRQAWSQMNGAHYVDWHADRTDRVTLGSVNVVPLFTDEQNALWCPEKDSATLSTIIGTGIDEKRQMLFDLLFMRGPEEQELQLGKGYRGRAHVGATALVAALVERNSALMKRLRTLMEDPSRRKVNVFIVGSAFGGTGAAGFPTLARALHRLRRQDNFVNGANVTLGGMLMLPYFTFNDDDDGDGQSVVTSDELLPKAQLALDHYHNLFQNEQALDHFYALGWRSLFHMGYHQAGAAEQSNPALPPELFAASAVLDFFKRTSQPGDQPDATRVMVSARDSHTVQWKDLPLADEIEPRLAQLLRFAVYWRYVASGMIDASSGLFGMGKNWIQKLSGGVKSVEAHAELSSLQALIDHVLLWAATIEKTGGGQWRPGPWSLHPFFAETGSPVLPVTQVDTVTEEAALAGFDQLVRVDNGEFVLRGGPDLHHDLKSGRVEVRNESRGLGMALATVAKVANLRGV